MVNTKQEDNISDDEDNIFYGEDKTRGKETLRNVVGERKLRRVFPATLYDGDDDGGGDDGDGGDGGGDDNLIVIVMVITMVIMMEVTSLSSLMVSPM